MSAGIEVASWMAPLALGLTVVSGLFLFPRSEDGGRRALYTALICLLLIFAAGLVVADFFIDKSYDGRSYHQVAVILLADGWNPLLEPRPRDFPGNRWVLHYPKAFWLAAAALYKFAGQIELAKAVHVLPLGGAFFLALSLLRRAPGLTTGIALMVALLATLNPVWITQSLSFYVDGQVASLLLALISVALLVIVDGARPFHLLLMAMIGILLVNVKFTGLPYAAMVILAAMAVLVLRTRWRDFRVVAMSQLGALLLAVGLVGFNPYVANTLNEGHPLYPLKGDRPVDIITGNSPVNLRGMDRLGKLMYGVFGGASNKIDEPAVLSWPFSPQHLEELGAYSSTDTRIAGFGPLFSGILVISFLVLLLRASTPPLTPTIQLALAVAAGILAMVVIHPEGWWARYTPQLWLLPLVAMVVLYASGRRWTTGLAYGIAALVAGNVALVGQQYLLSNYLHTQRMHETYASLRDNQADTYFYLQQFPIATRVQLGEMGAPFREVAAPESLPCSETKKLYGGGAIFCQPGAGRP
jgi:hypothetical protein